MRSMWYPILAKGIDQITRWLSREKRDHTVVGQAKNTFKKSFKNYHFSCPTWPKARMNVYYGYLLQFPLLL